MCGNIHIQTFLCLCMLEAGHVFLLGHLKPAAYFRVYISSVVTREREVKATSSSEDGLLLPVCLQGGWSVVVKMMVGGNDVIFPMPNNKCVKAQTRT